MPILERAHSVIGQTKSLILDTKLLVLALTTYLLRNMLVFDVEPYGTEYKVVKLIQSLTFEGVKSEIFYFGLLIGACLVVYGALKEYYPSIAVDRILFILTSLYIIYSIVIQITDGITYRLIIDLGVLLFIGIPRYIRTKYNVNINSVTIFLALGSYLLMSTVRFLQTMYPYTVGVYIDSLPDSTIEGILLTYFIGGVFFTIAILIHRLSIVLERSNY